MEMALSLATQIGAMFLMIVVGFILLRKGVLSIRDCNALSRIVLYVCTPCAIINSFQLKISDEKIKGFLFALIVAILINAFYILITQIFSKTFHFSPIEKASLIYPNCGNLIIPLVTLTMSSSMVFYCAAFMMIQTILLWTHCKSLISGERNLDWKAILSNINIIAIIVGIVFFLLQIQLPTLLSSAMTSMGNMMGPLSMFVAGMLLGEMNLKQIFGNIRAYLLIFFRLLVYPGIVLVLFIITRAYTFLPNATQILMISLLAASGPAASTVTQFAQVYDNQPFEASIINALSLIFCIVTMPLLNMIFMLLAK